MGSATGLTGGAGGGGQLLDQDTDALPPPCFITSLVGGKGEREGAAEGTETGEEAGAETGVGAGGGFGAMIGTGDGMAAGAGAAATATAGAGAGTAADTPPLTGVGSADDNFCWDETLSNIRTFATNSSASK